MRCVLYMGSKSINPDSCEGKRWLCLKKQGPGHTSQSEDQCLDFSYHSREVAEDG